MFNLAQTEPDIEKSKMPLGRLAKNLTGSVFNRLTVIDWAGRTAKGDLLWRCKCECGTERIVLARSLTSGVTRSCGCLSRDTAIETNTSHGLSRTAIYHAWVAMIARCEDQNHKAYKNYGGRGIKVCKRWKESVAHFVSDMGPRPSKQHTLDRIDNNGDYCPENCRWVTWDIQANNKRKAR